MNIGSEPRFLGLPGIPPGAVARGPLEGPTSKNYTNSQSNWVALQVFIRKANEYCFRALSCIYPPGSTLFALQSPRAGPRNARGRPVACQMQLNRSIEKPSHPPGENRHTIHGGSANSPRREAFRGRRRLITYCPQYLGVWRIAVMYSAVCCLTPLCSPLAWCN